MTCKYCASTFASAYGHPVVMDEGTCAACRCILTIVDQLYALDPPVVWDPWEYRVLTPACRAEDVDDGAVVGLRYLWPVGRSERAADV